MSDDEKLSDFSLVDAHQHFWHYTEQDYGWISEDMSVLRRDFLPGDLAPLLESQGIGGCVAVQARQSVEETDWLLSLAERNPLIRGVVGWIDLRAENLREQLQAYRGKALLKGFRHVLQDEADLDAVLDESFTHGVGLLGELGYSYDILVYSKQLPEISQWLERLPVMPLVIDHIAKPSIKNREWKPWAQQIEKLAQHQHLHCKLSGMVTETDWRDWEASTFRPYMKHILECFGPDRVMFGSDWPVCQVAADYGQTFGIVDRFIHEHCSEHRNALLGGNAKKFYRL